MRRMLGGPTLVVFGWAVVGLLIGHVASYDLVYPDGHVHAEVLAASGHQWLWLLEPSIVLGLVVAVLAGFVGSRGHQRRVARFRMLAGIQVGAFLGIEVAERLAHGVTPTEILHQLTDHGLWLVLVIGVAAQLLTAWFGSAASRFIADAAHQGPRRRSALPPRPGSLRPLVSHLASTPVVHAHGSRAPPGRLGLQPT
jgi:hypothetical protein